MLLAAFTLSTYCSASDARNQTTKGMWVAKAVGIEPFTVVMDLEGTDGRERGEVNHFLHANLFDVQIFCFRFSLFYARLCG
jgi:hypothetical protein